MTRAEMLSGAVSSLMRLLRVERREVLEEDLLADLLGRLEVDRLDLDQREVALALLRRPDLAGHGVAGVQVELPDLRRRDVDVVGAGQVVVVGRAQEAVAVRQHLEHAFGEDQAALLGARAQDLEDELLLAHARGVRDLELLGQVRELRHAHVLERGEVDHGRVAGLVAVFVFRGGSSLAIVVHRSSSPSPVAADVGRTGVFSELFHWVRARVRSPRESLSTFEATMVSVVRVVGSTRAAARGPPRRRCPSNEPRRRTGR